MADRALTRSKTSIPRRSGFRGPITMQFEYPLEGANDLDAKVRAMKEDQRVLAGWLKR